MIEYILGGLVGFGISTVYFKAKEFVFEYQKETTSSSLSIWKFQ